MKSSVKSRGLGRGLASLFGDEGADLDQRLDAVVADLPVRKVPVNMIMPSPYQPRRVFNEEALKELSASIEQHGLLQPIIVRCSANEGQASYQIVAGERRWRACLMAQIDEVEVKIIRVSDEEALTIGLIENLDRKDLSVIEQAHAIKRFIDEFHLTHERIAQLIGRSRAATTNIVRLLQLPDLIQDMLENNDLSMGHARALLALPQADQLELARRIIAEDLSVRVTEKIVQDILCKTDSGLQAQDAAGDKSGKNTVIDLQRLEERLSNNLGANVAVATNAKGAVKVTMTFANIDQVDVLLDKLAIERDL